MRVRAVLRSSFFVLSSLAVACGGSSSPSTPTSPSPTPTPTPPPSTQAACGALSGSLTGGAAILNGSECAATNSSVVLLNMRDATGFGLGSCSGTVISSRAILTAAHCLAGEVAVVRVWLGSGAEIVAESFVAHPSYRGTGASTVDVGVVHMGQDLGRTPIPLLLSRDARQGESAIVAGWGRDLSNVPATLRAGMTTITSVTPTLLETQFGSTVSSVCSGDSGGPIFLNEGGWSVAGVISATSQNVCNTGTNFYVAIRNATISSFVLGQVPGAARR